ncbi:MAG: thermonuclease family protein [Pseudomonadota bacterium]
MESLGLLASLLVILAAAALRSAQARRRARPTRRPADAPPRRASATISPFDPRRPAPAPAAHSVEGPAWVIDGDTIIVDRVQIRLFGIDAPELDHPFGRKAKWTLVSLCRERWVRAEIRDQDVHGRTVARCFLDDGRDLSAEMVRRGMALDWPKYSGGLYRRLETADARKKLWLADARQKGRMHVWQRFEASRRGRT